MSRSDTGQGVDGTREEDHQHHEHHQGVEQHNTFCLLAGG